MGLPTLLQPGMYEPRTDANSIERPIDILCRLYIKKLLLCGMQHRLHILQAFTGAGKSTVFPQELLNQIGESNKRAILMAEPRKALCDNDINDILNHNAWELGEQLVIHTGTKNVRSDRKAYIEFATTQIVQFFLDRILFASASGNEQMIRRLLRRYIIIVIDEAHILERQTLSVIRTIREILLKYGDQPDCPLFVFASATIDSNQIAKYFQFTINEENMSTIRGLPNYPIASNYMSDKLINDLNERGVKDVDISINVSDAELSGGGMNPFQTLAYFVYKYIYPKLWESKSTVHISSFDKDFQCRDALIFVPGIANINQITEALSKLIHDRPVFRIEQTTSDIQLKKWRKRYYRQNRVLLLGYSAEFSHLALELLASPYENDEDILEHESKIIVSTSVIETGKTIQTLYFCIDAGFDNKTIHSPLVFRPSGRWLVKAPPNKNQVMQRRGRVGRMAPGVFVAMYSKQVYESLQDADYPDTVNSGCLSSLLYASHLSFIRNPTRVEIGSFNSYLYPITPDLLIRSANDLFIGGLLGSCAQWMCKDAPKERWISYAIIAYYILKMPLFRAILTASLNRYKLPELFEINSSSSLSFPMSIEQCIESRYIHAPEFIVDGRKLFRDIVEGKSKYIIVYRNDWY